MGKSDVEVENYNMSSAERRSLVETLINEYRATSEAAEYIVVQAVSALKLDWPCRTILGLISD